MLTFQGALERSILPMVISIPEIALLNLYTNMINEAKISLFHPQNCIFPGIGWEATPVLKKSFYGKMFWIIFQLAQFVKGMFENNLTLTGIWHLKIYFELIERIKDNTKNNEGIRAFRKLNLVSFTHNCPLSKLLNCERLEVPIK